MNINYFTCKYCGAQSMRTTDYHNRLKDMKKVCFDCEREEKKALAAFELNRKVGK